MRDRSQALLRRFKGATATLLGGRAALTHYPGSQRMFLRAMRESLAFHFVHSPAYRELCLKGEFPPSRLRALADLAHIPAVPESEILPSAPPLLSLEGFPFDGVSLRRLRKLVRHVYGALGLTDRRRARRLPDSLPMEAWLERARELAAGRRLYWKLAHGVPCVACEEGRLHVPRYSHVHVRPDGRLQLLTPWMRSWAGLSLLTEDRGRVSVGCPCGRNAPVLELL